MPAGTGSHNGDGCAVRRRGKIVARWKGADGLSDERSYQLGDDGLRRPFKSKREAERFARTMSDLVREELRRMRDGTTRETVATVDALADRFLAEWGRGVGAKGGRPPESSTIRKVTAHLLKLRDEYGQRDPATLGKLELASWRLTLPEGSRHDVFKSAKQVLSWAVSFGLLERNPADGIDNPSRRQSERAPIVPLSEQEIQRICDELDVSDAALVRFLHETGCRPEEALGAFRSDIDWTRREITLQRRWSGGELLEGTKTEPSRIVPLSDKAVEALRGLPPRLDSRILFPAKRGGFRDLEKWRWRTWTAALGAAGVEYRKPYALRHSAATRMINAGHPLFLVARLLGTSVSMLEKTYGRPSTDDLHALVREAMGR
jgi:integrase